MRRAIPSLIGLLVFASAVASWPGVQKPPSQVLLNRAWVDRMPSSKKDIVSWFIPLQMRGKRFGVAQRSSHFWFAGERFTWEGSGERMTLTFQQSERKVTLRAKAYRCKGKAPSGFDLCLDLTDGRRSVTLYSRKGWTVPRADEADDPVLPAIQTTPVSALPCPDCAEGFPPALAPWPR